MYPCVFPAGLSINHKITKDNKSPELRNPCKAPSDWKFWTKAILQGTVFKGGQQKVFDIGAIRDICFPIWHCVAARGTAWGGGRLATTIPELKVCLLQTEESLFRLFFNNQVGSGIKALLSSFQDQQRELSYFCRVNHWVVIREGDATGIAWVQAFKRWAPEWGDTFSQPFSSQQLWPGQMLRKAQHMLIFGARVRTLLYLEHFWNRCSTEVVVRNCWAASSSRWWTHLWGCWQVS